jgi:RNA recognition motif-containing protein
LIIGKSDEEFVALKNLPIEKARERTAVRQKALKWRKEQEWVETMSRPDTGTTHFLRKITPIFREDGSLQYFIGYGIDITHQIEAELESLFMAGNKKLATDKIIREMEAIVKNNVSELEEAMRKEGYTTQRLKNKGITENYNVENQRPAHDSDGEMDEEDEVDEMDNLDGMLDAEILGDFASILCNLKKYDVYKKKGVLDLSKVKFRRQKSAKKK